MISLVTGGTGYLGGKLVEGLLARGEEVRVLRRSTSDVSRLSGAVSLVGGDVTDTDSLLRAAEGCGRIYHAAALVKTWTKDPREFDRINVLGTENLCEVAQRQGCRLVYTSSFFALGPTGPDPVSEDHTRASETFCTEYERTKTLADRRIRERIADGLDAVVLYPGLIYGPGPLTQGNYVSLLVRDYLRSRVPGIPGSGQQKWTYSFIEDVVQGHLLAADRAPSGSRYILGGPIATVAEVFAILEAITGKKPPRLHIPIPVLKGVGWAGEVWAALTGKAPQLTRGVAETYRHHWAYDCSRAKTELGYSFKPLAEGLAEVVDYMRGFSGR
jgi:farnesol dehydrogenase